MSTPTCPKCKSSMKLRNGKFGEFYGCSRYPKCNGIVNIEKGRVKRDLKRIDNPSDYQKAIFEAVRTLISQGVLPTGKKSIKVNATAGSGKTTLQEHITLMVQELDPTAKVVYTVYNNHVMQEAQSKGLPAYTTHSLFKKAISSFIGKEPKLDNNKVPNIIKSFIQETWDAEKWMISPVSQIVSKLKNLACPKDDATLEKVCDKFGIEVNGSAERIFELVRLTIDQNDKILDVIDFDDMLWLPFKHKMPLEQYDWVLGDEVQDWNRVQIELVARSCRKFSLVVGDNFQSMYSFRGAAMDAMDVMGRILDSENLPLTITYRCPKKHVELVNKLYPEIKFEAYEGAKEGVIGSMSVDRMLGQLKDGDLVLCRNNAPLVGPAFSLIRSGRKAIIRGRDIGKNLISLIERFNVKTVDDLIDKMLEYKDKEMPKLLKAEKHGQAQSLEDKVETILAISEGCMWVSEVVKKIDEIFQNDNKGVVFSTIHRAKGDEAENVYVLYPQLSPSKYARTQEELDQERNICFVRDTRSKWGLFYVGGPVPVREEEMWEGNVDNEYEWSFRKEESIETGEPIVIIKQEPKETEKPFIAQVERMISEEIVVADKMIEPEIKQVPECPF